MVQSLQKSQKEDPEEQIQAKTITLYRKKHENSHIKATERR
jgi:hypothetical protein